MKLFIFLFITSLFTGCVSTSDNNLQEFITPHHGIIKINNVSQFDRDFHLSFAGFEGLFFKYCDDSFNICYKIIPNSLVIDPFYQTESSEAKDILAQVGRFQVDYLAIHFYTGQSDSIVHQMLENAYQAQGFNIQTLDSVYKPLHYTSDVIEYTIIGNKDNKVYKLCKYFTSVSNNKVSQIIILSSRASN
jgi:hypothetical protein